MGSRRLGGALRAAAGVALVALLAFVPTVHAAFPGSNGDISFARTNASHSDIYTIDQWSNGPATNITNQNYSRFSAWSPNGNRIAFSQSDKIYTADPDGSQKVLTLDWAGTAVWDLDWAPDSDRLVAELWTCDTEECHQDIYTMNLDGSDLTNITVGNGFDDRHPAWSPDGTKIAFDSVRNGESGIYTMNPDGSGEAQLTQSSTGNFDINPDWSPDSARLAFSRGTDDTFTFPGGLTYIMNADGSELAQHPNAGFAPSWSPDGLYIASGGGGIHIAAVTGYPVRRLTGPPSGWRDVETDWRPMPAVNPPPTGSGYPRPKGASPVDVSLVPAYQACTEAAANRTHGPPLAFPSCAPPVRTSGGPTVGTADSNGQPTQALGRVKVGVLAGEPGGPDDADVRVDASQTDVRRGGDMSDYEGELTLRVPLRITDKWSGGGTDASATVTDLPLRFRVPCAYTAVGNIGAHCQVSTTVEAVYPGAIPESKRSVWQVGDVGLYTSGPDGLADTADGGTLFAVQGVLVP
jgi:WD40-like Beta Propeller Repeat